MKKTLIVLLCISSIPCLGGGLGGGLVNPSLSGGGQFNTNAPTFYNGTNYGPFTIPESIPGVSNDEVLNFGTTGAAQFWYNLTHSVEPELQIGIQGSISFTIGQDNQGKGTGHLGGSGAYHSLWYMQYDDFGLTNAPGHSTPFGYALHLNQGTAQNFMFGYWYAEQDSGMAQTYRLNWHDSGGRPSGGFNQAEFMATDHIAGGLGSNTIFWGGAELTNTIVHGNATSLPGSTNLIDFSYSASDYLVLTPVAALTLVATNASYTNKTITKHVVIQGGFNTITLSFPTNWITLTNSLTALTNNPIPSSVSGSNDLYVDLVASFGLTTNYYASYSIAYNVPTLDTNTSQFLTASGIVDPTIKASVNTFCLTAKANNFWTKIVAFHPHVGGTSNTCSWNLVNTNLYRTAWIGGVSFASTGVTGNGTTGYGDLNLIPSTALLSTSTNSSSMFVWIRSPANIIDGSYPFGVDGNNSARWGMVRSGGSVLAAGMNANAIEGGSTTSGNWVGMLGQNRTGNTTQQDYLNGVPIGGTTGRTAVSALPTGQSVFILARNGPPVDHFSDCTLMGDCVAENMTAQNVADLQAAWSAMNTSLGR